MPFVLKTEPVKTTGRELLSFSARPFAEDIRGNGFIESFDRFVWFHSESKGGTGLFALGRAGKLSRDIDERGRRVVCFDATITNTKIQAPLTKRDFARLERAANQKPIEKLNQLLYVHSHEKAAPIDSETFAFLESRFSQS